MAAVEKFNEWLKSKEPDRYGLTIEIVIQRAELLGYSRDDVRQKVKELRHWLIANEGSSRVNKKTWGKFILRNLAPKTYNRQSARLTPSRFE